MFSPKEAACVAVVYAFFLSVILYKGMTIKEIYQALVQTVADGAGILNIICGAAAFSWLVTMMGMTDALSHALPGSFQQCFSALRKMAQPNKLTII